MALVVVKVSKELEAIVRQIDRRLTTDEERNAFELVNDNGMMQVLRDGKPVSPKLQFVYMAIYLEGAFWALNGCRPRNIDPDTGGFKEAFAPLDDDGEAYLQHVDKMSFQGEPGGAIAQA